MDNSKGCSFPSARILSPVGIALLAFLAILFAGSVTQAGPVTYKNGEIYNAPNINTSNYDSTNFVISEKSKRTYRNKLSGSGIVNFIFDPVQFSSSTDYYLNLTGDNSAFSGTFNVNTSNTAIWFSSANSGFANGTLNLASKTYVRVALTSDGTIYLGALEGSGYLRNDQSSNNVTVTFEIGGANKDATFSGFIMDKWSGHNVNVYTAVKKVGTGTQTLSNNNTYTKGTTISGGTLKLTGDGTLGTGAVTIGENGTLEFAYDSAKTFNNSISLSGTIANTSTATLTLSSAITLTGNTTFDTTTDLTVPNIARNDDYTVTKEGSGTLTFSKRTLIKHLTIKEGTMSLNRDSNYGGLLLGSEITVDGNNSVLDGYGNGSTTNNGGVLGVIGYNGADPLGTLCLKNKGTLKNSSQNKCVIISYTVNMENGIITSTGNGDSTYGNYIFDTPVYVKSSQSNLIEASSLTIRNYNNKLSTSACGGIFDVAQDAKLTVTSSIKGSYVPLVKDGEGELVLTGDNVYSQGTTISEGTLKLSGNGTLGTGAVTVSENAELEIAYDNPEKSVSISSITMDLQSAITVTCGTVTFNPGDVSLNNLAGGSLDQSGHTAVASHLVVTGNLTLLNDEDEMSKFIGSISAGNYSITKSGDGTLQLYGEAEGSIDASSLIVSSGRLDLKGCLTGQIEVDEGAEFSPGNSVGEAKSDGNFILNQSAKLLIEQDETGIDKLTVKSFTDNGGFINLLINGIPSGSQYDIITATNGFDSSQDESYWLGKLGALPDYMTLSIISGEYGANSQTVRLLIDRNAVPEPSTWALLAFGVAVVLFLRKRK